MAQDQGECLQSPQEEAAASEAERHQEASRPSEELPSRKEAGREHTQKGLQEVHTQAASAPTAVRTNEEREPHTKAQAEEQAEASADPSA